MDEILNLMESVSEGFPSYSYTLLTLKCRNMLFCLKPYLRFIIGFIRDVFVLGMNKETFMRAKLNVSN